MSSKSWTFYNPVKVILQPGAVRCLGEFTDSSRVALVTTEGFRRRGVVDEIQKSFDKRLVAVVDDVKPNPDIPDVQLQADRLREFDIEVLVAVGGGSSIDTAKALARVLGQKCDVILESWLQGSSTESTSPALPVIAVPSTAGTGAEVTPFGTIWDHTEKKKYSITGDDLYPVLAILDPELTLYLPEEVTVSSGLDAISHALESTWNRNANAVSLSLATRSLQLSIPALPVVKEKPRSIGARTDMLQASMLAGLAISQSRTALAHSISYPLTARFGLPHGFACSFTLPDLLRFNSDADDGRLLILSRSLGFKCLDQLQEALSSLMERLDMNQYLAKYLPDSDSVIALTDEMFTPGRAENNLRQATERDVRALLTRAIKTAG